MTLALVIHELSTNSVKYGSHSVPEGTLDVSFADQERELLVPRRNAADRKFTNRTARLASEGKLVANSVASQLAGNLEYDSAKAGLIAKLAINKERLCH